MTAPVRTLSEADLCAAFIAAATKPDRRGAQTWTAYPETAGFDILLVRDDGCQIGIEAKLVLNTRVIAQALPAREGWAHGAAPGPDYRAVLVPSLKVNADLSRICAALGVTVIEMRTLEPSTERWDRGFWPDLPKESGDLHAEWHPWAPAVRCPVPDYIPDVRAGCSAPVALTAWKVKAIRLAVLLEERPVTRADFKALQLSPTNWLCPGGWLTKTDRGWIAGPGMPDFRAQHPRNYGEIAADKARWDPAAATLFAGGAA